MKLKTAALILGLAACAPALSQTTARPSSPVDTAAFSTTYIRLASRGAEGLLYTPGKPGPNARIALLFSHPSGNNFNDPIAAQMASRGYRILTVNYRGTEESDDYYLPSISDGVAYLRTLPGVEKVVVIGHSGGGHLIAMYANIAENGVAACQGAEKIYPCKVDAPNGLAKPDGVVLLDPTLGAFHQMSSIDPAAGGKHRNARLDMFAPANGYDRAAKRATYSPEFARRFLAGQSARSEKLIDAALARVKAVDAGKGAFSDDEPFIVPGMGVTSSGARLYQPDTAFVSHTKAPHLLLRADGSDATVVVRSVRGPSGQQAPEMLRTLEGMARYTTARKFLAVSAIRTLPGYNITADDITGVDWKSAFTATPANAEGIAVPTLVVTMSCHYLVVPGEIIFDHLAARDKTLASVEGATHVFTPCRPEYGDTVKRNFDFLDGWLSKPGRF